MARWLVKSIICLYFNSIQSFFTDEMQMLRKSNICVAFHILASRTIQLRLETTTSTAFFISIFGQHLVPQFHLCNRLLSQNFVKVHRRHIRSQVIFVYSNPLFEFILLNNLCEKSLYIFKCILYVYLW